MYDCNLFGFGDTDLVHLCDNVVLDIGLINIYIFIVTFTKPMLFQQK